VYTAPNAFGTYTVKATSVEDPSQYAIATVIVSAQSGSDRSFTYDANGNLLDDGVQQYEWDVENRLVKITKGSHITEFEYDPLGRRSRIIEKGLDAQAQVFVSSDKRYLWDSAEIVEEQAPTGATLKQFYGQGFIDSDGTKLYYTRDHLGSVRELTDSTQVVRARYDYDPYGRVTKISGDKDSLFLYTGHLWHQQSGLYLTLYRAYDPETGRWISRDPIAERGGLNIYAYVMNDPINLVDPLGLSPFKTFAIHFAVAAVITVAASLLLGPVALVALALYGAYQLGRAYGELYEKAGDPCVSDDEFYDDLAALYGDVLGSLFGGWAAGGFQSGLARGGASSGSGAGAFDSLADGDLAEVTGGSSGSGGGMPDGNTVIAETLSGKGNFTSNSTVSAAEGLDAGGKFLGEGYTELGKPGSGVFRSADGLRGFRIDPNSLSGSHAPNVPHMHFELYQPGAAKPYVNNHVPFFE
jgi:RHS repeat-associated protein